MRYDYDRNFGRGMHFRRRMPLPPPDLAWLPGSYMGQEAADGWGWWGGPLDWPPYPRIQDRYDYEYRWWRPTIDPRRSPMYGRGGDRAARRWAERYGYDIEMTIRPARRREGWPSPYR